LHLTDRGMELNSLFPFDINNTCNPNRTDMEKFNCKKLNKAFNTDGLDYILIEDIKEEFNSIFTFNIHNKKEVKGFIKKKAQILKISRSGNEDIIYQKEKVKNNNIDSINEWIDNTFNELLKKQNNLLTHLDWKNSQIKKFEKLPLGEYKRIRESFIDYITSIDCELEDNLCKNQVIKSKSPCKVNLEKRGEKIKAHLKHQKDSIRKNKNMQDFSKFIF
jgi:hypothetical protein